MKECLKPHSVVHTVLGIGVGLVLANWLTGLSGQTGMVIGLFTIIAAFLGELYVAGQKKR
ncbi:hypothetical protein A3D05_02865 [Candidatus Gottesmanbacteria bacterium RIFCSPHIGHO2_02_FULL_40_24]|uniref:Uncharacterized protein n=1 Tax=Candidatus Gottesmanbacteria bacterium RIFCSPHIGHO2_01_FULL_40_15 TaxID=1798376 RepID=A0A1F5Z0P6_9BACT|nr:MAG: hypothetical protein A2777_00740 [Candidatus Gottesmanbacteria bacterium RIFCSPHIGHO2_01_FULL_40_15]OGG17448.1 MAG: hypothetical protein A3D05_02865 [Candidatus Gottesmanbacteria bacterium RIFCSPHIGHO2_02_FULL_40_24]OGG22144.1 MAG: hypothetical protein A3B48_01615 [Candidatus Gottesmanbacteria bacterium RIFCSPLOWO2_01_FULL_40_10]OGG25103.1 MAG: hypothetical protein A3E42_00865 [Candidatus Gottesmanbacteria bacterium RIFCSPHIGHO2_12_FULL_40_13]OGG32775.1 MAG: hypothetical protein A3I80_0